MNISEIALLLNGFNINEAKKQLDALHKLSSKEYLVYQKKRLDEIVRFHRENNLTYKDKTKGLQINSFTDLPIITKKDFQKPIESIISKGYKVRKLYIGSTSGSSGHPLTFAKNKESHALAHAIAFSCYSEYGINLSSKQARFYCIPGSGMSRYHEMLKDIVLNRIRFSVSDISDKQFNAFVGKFRREEFDYINGYTTSLVHFARYLIRNNIVLKNIDPKLKCCIVTSEVCTLDDKEILEKAFGIKVVNEYGASEVGILAFEDTQGDWRIQTDDLYVEVVDAQDKPLEYGKEGRILITCLSNKAFPIIRYEIGDLGVLDEKEGKLILKKLLGRTRDIIQLPSGRMASGVIFSYITNPLLKNTGIIHELIVRQTKIDTFELDAVMERDLTIDEINFLNSELAVYLEPGLHLIINRVDKIERPVSGKFKLFYSMIN